MINGQIKSLAKSVSCLIRQKMIVYLRVKSFCKKITLQDEFMVSLSYQYLRKIQTTRRVILCISLSYFLVVFHTIMMNFINKVLCHFESCFSRKASFGWLVTIILGLMLRSVSLVLPLLSVILRSVWAVMVPCSIFSAHSHGCWKICVCAGFRQ